MPTGAGNNWAWKPPGIAGRGPNAQDVERCRVRSNEWDHYLQAKSVELGSKGFRITLENDCATKTVDVTLGFKLPDDSNWMFTGWWSVKPGSAITPAIVSDHPRFLIYAKDQGSSGTEWTGAGQPDAHAMFVIDENFACPTRELLSGTHKREVSMFSRRAKDQNLIVSFTAGEQEETARIIAPIELPIVEEEKSRMTTGKWWAIGAATAALGIGAFLDRTEAGQKMLSGTQRYKEFKPYKHD